MLAQYCVCVTIFHAQPIIHNRLEKKANFDNDSNLYDYKIPVGNLNLLCEIVC